MDCCTGVVVLAVLVALAAVVPRGSIALDAFELTVESAIVKITSLGPIDGAVLVVVAEWVTAADFLWAVGVVCCAIHGLNPIACICIVVAVACRYVVFAALVRRDAEVSAPAIGALNIAFAAALCVRTWLIYRHAEWTIWAKALLHVVRAFLHVRARLIYRHAEWTIWAKALLHVIRAFLHVRTWLVGWCTEWTIWAVAILFIGGALWGFEAGKVAEASALDVAVFVTTALVIRLTRYPALVLTKAALGWVIAGTVGITRRHVIRICVLGDAGSCIHFTPEPIRALAISAAWRETGLVQSGTDESCLAVAVCFAALGHCGAVLVGRDTHKSAHGLRALDLIIRAGLHVWAWLAFRYAEVSTHTICTFHVVVWTALHTWARLVGSLTEWSKLVVADLLVIAALRSWVVIPAAEPVL